MTRGRRGKGQRIQRGNRVFRKAQINRWLERGLERKVRQGGLKAKKKDENFHGWWKERKMDQENTQGKEAGKLINEVWVPKIGGGGPI